MRPATLKVAEHHHGPGETLRADASGVGAHGQDERRSGFVVELNAGVVAPVSDLHAGEGHVPVGRAEHVGGARRGEDEVADVVEGGAHGCIVSGVRGVCVGLEVDFRGAFRDARRLQVDPGERPKATRRMVEVENVIAPLVLATGLAESHVVRVQAEGLDERGVTGSEANDDVAIGLAVLEHHPPAVKRGDDDGGAGGEDVAGGVKWCDHARIVTKSMGVCVA